MSQEKILYLGLKKKKGSFHYPVIRLEPVLNIEEPLKRWDAFTHILFTSQSTVKFWKGPFDKVCIAIGEKTAEALKEKGKEPLLAPFATAEGMIERIKEINGYFFYPKSSRSRMVISDYLKAANKRFFAFDLYHTHFQSLQPIPNLDDFDTIVFTSPSTVDGFLRIYKNLPKDKKLKAIGPITSAHLQKFISMKSFG